MGGRAAAVIAVVLAVVSGATAQTAAASGSGCTPWNVRTVAGGLGVLENLEPDTSGGMLISNNGANEIDRLTPDGRVTTLIPNVPSPGGQRIHGGQLYFNTGDSAQAGGPPTTPRPNHRPRLPAPQHPTGAERPAGATRPPLL